MLMFKQSKKTVNLKNFVNKIVLRFRMSLTWGDEVIIQTKWY